MPGDPQWNQSNQFRGTRSVLPHVVGRKHRLFFKTYDAAETAAGKLAVRRSGSASDRITLPNPAKSRDCGPSDKSTLRARMNFNNQPIGSHRHGRARNRRNQALLARSVRRIGDHRQM